MNGPTLSEILHGTLTDYLSYGVKVEIRASLTELVMKINQRLLCLSSVKISENFRRREYTETSSIRTEAQGRWLCLAKIYKYLNGRIRPAIAGWTYRPKKICQIPTGFEHFIISEPVRSWPGREKPPRHVSDTCARHDRAAVPTYSRRSRQRRSSAPWRGSLCGPQRRLQRGPPRVSPVQPFCVISFS